MALPTRLLPTRPGISVQLPPLASAKNRSQFHPPRARPFPGPLLRRNPAAVWRRPRALPSYPSPQARPSAASPAPQADRSLRIPLPFGHTVLRASGQSVPAAACRGGRRVRVRRCGGSGRAPRTLRARSLGSPFASVSTRGYRRAGCRRTAGEVDMLKQKQGRASQAPSQVTRDRPLPRAHVGASGAGSTKHTTGRTGRQGAGTGHRVRGPDSFRRVLREV